MDKQHWQDWIRGAIGAWLAASPFVLGFALPDGVAAPWMTWNFVIAGALAVALAAASLAAFAKWEEWLGVALGVWLIVSPWALGFAPAQSAMINAVACGAAITLLSAWTLYESTPTRRA